MITNIKVNAQHVAVFFFLELDLTHSQHYITEVGNCAFGSVKPNYEKNLKC